MGASTWVYSGELPSPRGYLRGINIDDKILMTGGYTKGWIGTGDDSIISDEILEFDSLTGQWKIVDRMIQTRGAHAMAAIDFDPGLCTNPPTTEPPTTAALIISGGYPLDSAGISVEVFVPTTGQHCQLPSLPGGRRSDHSVNDRTICGGGVYNVYSASRRSCLTLNSNGNWLETTSLLEQRYHHSSWASPSGLILMGGRGSKRTTEKIEADGTSTYSFELKYDIDLACPINLGSTVVITGDRHDQTRVTEYSEAGFSRDLPQLQQGRYQHGCNYFNNQDGTRTLLVSGGYGLGEDNFNNYLLSSTELLVESASTWVYSGELPSPRGYLRGINIDDKILMTGGYTKGWIGTGDDSIISDEILEFDSLTGQWKIVDRMIQTRGAHAMAAIDFDPGLCTNPPTTEPPTTAALIISGGYPIDSAGISVEVFVPTTG